MSTHKYRKLLTNLPSMAAVVNSFQSTEVQLEVYKLLVAELEEVASEGVVPLKQSTEVVPSDVHQEMNDGEVAHQLVDGESIHSITDEDEVD